MTQGLWYVRSLTFTMLRAKVLAAAERIQAISSCEDLCCNTFFTCPQPNLLKTSQKVPCSPICPLHTDLCVFRYLQIYMVLIQIYCGVGGLFVCSFICFHKHMLAGIQMCADNKRLFNKTMKALPSIFIRHHNHWKELL